MIPEDCLGVSYDELSNATKEVSNNLNDQRESDEDLDFYGKD
ncbi:hypothetical protein N8891_03735 [Flavobacteriales bacterium]|nr:hypothetical protein [Flavobacteriales bacterium]